MGVAVVRLPVKPTRNSGPLALQRVTDALSATTWIGLEHGRWDVISRAEDSQRMILFCPRIPGPDFDRANCFYQYDSVFGADIVFEALRFEEIPAGRRFVEGDLQVLADRFRKPFAVYDFHTYMHGDAETREIGLKRVSRFVCPSRSSLIGRWRFQRALRKYGYDQ